MYERARRKEVLGKHLGETLASQKPDQGDLFIVLMCVAVFCKEEQLLILIVNTG